MTKRWSATPESEQLLVVRIAIDPDRDDDRERIEAWVGRLHPTITRRRRRREDREGWRVSSPKQG